jgi:hypothetical protein
MISRRRFLEVGGVAAGVAAVSHPLLASGPGQHQTPADSSLPSLARSESQKSEASPVTREGRLELAEVGMNKPGIAGPAATGSQTSAKEQMSQAAAPSIGGNSGQNPDLVVPQILVVSPEDARVYSQGLGEARIQVGGERSGGAWWLGQFREDPGFMTGSVCPRASRQATCSGQHGKRTGALCRVGQSRRLRAVLHRTG